MRIFRRLTDTENRIVGLETRIGFIEAKFSVLEQTLAAVVEKGLTITVRDARKQKGERKPGSGRRPSLCPVDGARMVNGVCPDASTHPGLFASQN